MLDLESKRKLLKLEKFFVMAQKIADLSTCKRAQCGAMIVPPDFSAVLAVGYNGPARDEDNDSCTGEVGKCGCVHAETNALIKLRYTGMPGLAMLSTTCPCRECAGLIINSGVIDEVLWLGAYRNDEGCERLRRAGISAHSLGDVRDEYAN